MATKKEREAIERANAIRHLAAALPHADVYTMLTALEVYAATIEAVDRRFPDPEKRATARDAEYLADLCRVTNMARDSQPLGTVPALTTKERDYLIALLGRELDPDIPMHASIAAKLQGDGDNTKAVR